jgi:hypothetical protein
MVLIEKFEIIFQSKEEVDQEEQIILTKNAQIKSLNKQ